MIHWLLEPDVFEKDEVSVIDALERTNTPYTVTKLGKGYEEYAAEAVPNTVLHGSFQFARVLRKAAGIRGIYCNLTKLSCFYYYPRFGSLLLNRDYVMLPFGELDRRNDWLLKVAGNADNVLFVRPATGDKSFTGQLLKLETWAKDIKLMGFYDVQPEEIVIVASPVAVLKEWRCVVVNNRVVASSQYKENGQNVRFAQTPREVLNYAASVLDAVKYQPDPAWTLDICETADGLSVLEVGSFSCAGWYAADPEAIIQSVGELFS